MSASLRAHIEYEVIDRITLRSRNYSWRISEVNAAFSKVPSSKQCRTNMRSPMSFNRTAYVLRHFMELAKLPSVSSNNANLLTMRRIDVDICT